MGKDPTSSLKKKRKTANTESENEIDMYKRVVEYEEKESHNHLSSLDAEIFFGQCQDIRNMLKEIFEQKQADSSSNKNTMKELQTEIFMKLCVIKKLNRIDKIKHVLGKETLSNEKQKCDSIKLSYQNLVYELHHLVAETSKCLAFKSKDEDIELVTFEDFMKEAPEELSEKFEKYNNEDRAQKHNLRLARLEWELTQRKSLAQLCKSLVEEQKKLGKDLVEYRDKLEALRPLLLSIINSTKPLQEHLDISLNELRVEHKLAFLLPGPLYIFYVNIVSYRSVYDLNLIIEIVGDEDEATRWKETYGSSESTLLQEDDESEHDVEAPEVEEVVEVKKRRHRKSVQQVDPVEEKKKKLLEVHPLCVEVLVKIKSGLSIKITFQYHTKLKIVTVTSKANIPSNITGNSAQEILYGEYILNELIEGDFGTQSPNPITSYQLKRIGINSYESLVPDVGFAFQWAQRVCGMDFITNQMNSDQIGSANVENVVKILLKRLQTRYHLANQLQQLEQNILPKIPDSLKFSTNPICSLTKWSSSTYQKFCQSEFTQLFIEEELVSPSDLFYIVNFNRDSANLQSFIVIKNNYPEAAPIFSLSITYNNDTLHSINSDEIRDMECILNTYWNNEECSSSWLLSAQMTQLCFLFDVYLETTHPKVFQQNATYIRNICARNRKRPFRFRKMGTGIFTQY